MDLPLQIESLRLLIANRQKAITQLPGYSDIAVEMEKLKELLDKTRASCTHEVEWVSRVSKGNTGNYDPHCDRYWHELTCKCCGEYWVVDSETSPEEYYKYKHSKENSN